MDAISTRDSRWRVALGRLGVRFDPGEAGPALLLFAIFFLLITFQYSTKSVRQSTFINSLGAEKLPYVYLLIALAAYPLLQFYNRFADRWRRDTLIVATCAFIAATMALFWWLYQFPWQWVAFAFYVWISIAVIGLVSQFWSFANHIFDPRQAKRLFAFVGAGGLLGGVFGGQLAKFATKSIGTRYALLVAAVVLLIVAALIWLTRRLHPIDERRVAGAAGLKELNEAGSGIELLRQSKHLRAVAAIMLLTVVVAQIVDLQFNWAVEKATTSLDQRTAFFGNFYSAMGIMAFAFQLIFTARIHRRLGVGFAMRVLPVSMTVGTLALIGAAVAAPEMLLAAAVALKVSENGVRYSVDQSTRELLYLPIPSRARMKAKAFIDVFIQRAGKGVAALLLLPVTFRWLTAPQAGWISLALIVVWLTVTVAARTHYIESFRAGLKKKALEPGVIDLNDATALELVVQSLGSTDARQVIHALRLLQDQDRAKLVPPLLLYHESAVVRRAVLPLVASAARIDALPLVERCLSDSDAGVRAEAVASVAQLRKTDVVSLMTPYLASTDAGLRSAAIVALWNATEDGAKKGARAALSELMADNSTESRAEAAKALGFLETNDRADALTLLLADKDPRVVREAVGAVRRRVARHGPDPMLAPALIALLDDRRLKHDARQALVAFGEPVIPALVHFMNSPDERLWVRRALPKTIALIDGPQAVAALAGSLPLASDAFLLRKLIEGLGTTTSPLAGHEREIVDAVARQSARYFRALATLAALGSLEHGRLTGPLAIWDGEQHEATLLERMLSEQMSDSVGNVFRLLALLYDRVHIRNAHSSVTSGQPGLIAAAVEYLDNVLAPPVNRVVLPMIDDRPLAQRLDAARRLFTIGVGSRVDVLTRLLDECVDTNDAGWGAAALWEIYATRAATLYPGVERVRSSECADPLARETAEWIARRIEIAALT